MNPSEEAMSSQPHHALLHAAAGGDPSALEALVRAYHDRVYRFGLRVCRDPFDADDAVQDAFFKLARRSDVVAAPTALAWLFTVVKHTCLKLARVFIQEQTRLADRAGDVAAMAQADEDPEVALERWRLVDAVHRAIAALEPDTRAAVVLRDLEGMCGDEVAKALNISEAAMKSRLHRGRQQIRVWIEKEMSPGDAHVRQ